LSPNVVSSFVFISLTINGNMPCKHVTHHNEPEAQKYSKPIIGYKVK